MDKLCTCNAEYVNKVMDFTLERKMFTIWYQEINLINFRLFFQNCLILDEISERSGDRPGGFEIVVIIRIH